MNHCVPAWNFEGDLPVTNQKKAMGPEHELVGLLWQNGQVVFNSQTHRKLNDQPRNGSFESSGHLIQDDETVSWIHNSFEEELCSSLFNDLPSLDHVHSDKVPVPNHAVTPSEQQPNRVPPPRFQLPGSSLRSSSLVGFKKITNLPTKGDIGASGGSGTLTQGKVRQGSAMAVRSSHCGSNQIQNDPDWSGVGPTGLSARPLKVNLQKAIQTTEPALTTSSGGSDGSFGRTCRQSTNFSTDHKRKRPDEEQSPSQSEAAELESAGGCKSSSRQSKRSRAAEVHNLSERRRRDRINEKMKALQELIPHCSKTDKASMLDEVIEYLKSLQLQLQVMWMGGGMGPSPMMFPGFQQYMSQMNMGMGSPSLPLTNHSMSVAQTPNQSVNYPNQVQNPSLPEQYARYMGFLQMQNAAQPLNMNMLKFSSQAMQQSQPMAPPVSSIGPFSCGATANNLTSG